MFRSIGSKINHTKLKVIPFLDSLVKEYNKQSKLNKDGKTLTNYVPGIKSKLDIDYKDVSCLSANLGCFVQISSSRFRFEVRSTPVSRSNELRTEATLSSKTNKQRSIKNYLKANVHNYKGVIK